MHLCVWCRLSSCLVCSRLVRVLTGPAITPDCRSIRVDERQPPLVSAAAAIYTAAGLICHQRAARSFHLAGCSYRCAPGARLSTCQARLARCSRMGVSRRPRVPAHTRRILLWAALPTALSVILEWGGIVDPTNVGRALCALPLGASAGWIFVQSLRAEAAEADAL